AREMGRWMSGIPFERRSYAGAAVQSTLASSITGADLTISVASASGWPDGTDGPFYVVIDPGGTEEKIRVTSRSGNVLTVAALSDRGTDGTAAASHTSGVTVYPSYTAVDA